jgi:hypothetical protein
MNDHPIIGAALFVIGAFLIGAAYYGSNVQLQLFSSSDVLDTGQEISSLILGHVLVLNGVALVVLGCRKKQSCSLMK